MFSQRTAFLFVFGLISVVLVGSSLGLVGWIYNRIRPPAAAAAPNTTYVNYDPAGDYLTPDSLQKMTEYVAANPEPQNVQVLQGMNTGQIAAYMVSQVSGGLKVGCAYCHALTNGNFADDSNPNKDKARQMMLMAADLNQNWITQLPASVGEYQVTCATCHNGQPVFRAYPEDQSPLPDDYRLPLDNLDALRVTGQDDPQLDEVQINQYTMAFMNKSLGVGCAFCHNANYFPSNEIPNKGYALIMLRMVQHLEQNYNRNNGGLLLNQTPSCYTCHVGQQIPPGAAVGPQAVPAVLSSNPPPGAAGVSTCLLCSQSSAPGTAGAQAARPSR